MSTDAEEVRARFCPPEQWWRPEWEPPKKRRRIRLWEAAGKKCHWCGRETILTDEQIPNQATIDHVISQGNGGPDTEDNMVSACYECNQRRNHESTKGLPEGSLLGQFSMEKRGKQKAGYRVVLTGDDKKAIMNNQPRQVPIRLTNAELYLQQRDQALRRIDELSAQLEQEKKHHTEYVRWAEGEIQHLRTGFWTRLRRTIGLWLAR